MTGRQRQSQGLNPERYFKVPNAVVLDERFAGLSSAAKAVLLVLYAFRNARKGAAWPRQRRLTEVLGLSLRAVNGAIQELESAGFIGKAREWLGDVTGTTYRFPHEERRAAGCVTVNGTDTHGDAQRSGDQYATSCATPRGAGTHDRETDAHHTA